MVETKLTKEIATMALENGKKGSTGFVKTASLNEISELRPGVRSLDSMSVIRPQSLEGDTSNSGSTTQESQGKGSQKQLQ